MDDVRQYTPEERVQIQRFVNALNHVMISSGVSQRGLAGKIGVSVGTITKYVKGTVPPFNVGLGIQYNLAKSLGVTLDALYHYYVGGEYATAVSVEDVASWIRSDAGQEALPLLMECLSDAARRWTPRLPAASTIEAEVVEEEPLKPWHWPEEERLTLTGERVTALVEQGEYDEELIEGFAVACNYKVDAVRVAFEEREAIA
jgi:transcriptional regulator with XRE-family HTH domain